MIMTKRIVSTLLILSVILSFVACSGSSDENKPNNTSTTTAPTTTANPDIVYEEDDLPANLDFGEEEVVFLTPTGKEGSHSSHMECSRLLLWHFAHSLS